MYLNLESHVAIGKMLIPHRHSGFYSKSRPVQLSFGIDNEFPTLWSSPNQRSRNCNVLLSYLCNSSGEELRPRRRLWRDRVIRGLGEQQGRAKSR